MTETMEDLFRPPKHCAVKFDEKDSAKGEYLLACRGSPGVALRGEIFIVPKEDVDLINKTNLKYRFREVWTNDPQEIREYFGIK